MASIFALKGALDIVYRVTENGRESDRNAHPLGLKIFEEIKVTC